MPVLEAAWTGVGSKKGLLPGVGFCNVPMSRSFRSTRGKGTGEAWRYTTEAQQAAKRLWFANLNTPEEFAEAERFVDALDT